MKNKKIILVLTTVIFTLFLYGCSSGGNKFGPLGSTHDHTDIKIYILGKALDFTGRQYQVAHDAVHFENSDGDVIHTHATGITLGFMFEKHRMSIDVNCITLDTGNQYCSDGNAELKVFVKSIGTGWDQIYSPADYIIQDLDKILITFGTEDGIGIQKQMESVTDKARTY